MMTSNIRKKWIFLILGFALVFLGVPSVGLSRIIPGQVIVKFASDSEGEMAVAIATQDDPPDLTVLGPATADLQAKTGVFLKPTQITGDQRVVFLIDVDLLTNDLELRLHKRRNVETIQLNTEALATQARISPPKKLLVSFMEGSTESESLRQQSNHQNKEFTTLLSSLEKDLRLPLDADITQEGKLLLWVDLEKLTLILVEQLNPLPEIESAQPNYAVTVQ